MNNSVQANCGWCEKEFQTRDKWQLIAVNCGRNVYCSKECGVAFERRRAAQRMPHFLGPCPVCGNMFRSRIKNKTYCSMPCYIRSDTLYERLIAMNPSNKPGVRLPVTDCHQCGAKIKNRNYIKKFCSKDCRRKHYAERFDRWVANPETLALPQCYDEFLMQEELPCLVDGCEWKGKRLAWHCNAAHGIRAEELKELAGFNKTTGLVPPDMRARMSERMRGYIESGKLTPTPFPEDARGGRPGRRTSLENSEHLVKGQTLAKATAEPKPDGVCLSCGGPVKQLLMGKQIYCSKKCRHIEYSRRGRQELTCDYCGAKYLGAKQQIARVQRGQKVCCSKECRNRMNMIACLTARKLKKQR